MTGPVYYQFLSQKVLALKQELLIHDIFYVHNVKGGILTDLGITFPSRLPLRQVRTQISLRIYAV